jgi:hypothetical protein
VDPAIATLEIDSTITLDQVIEKFLESDQDLFLIEKELQVHQPYLDELTDFPHSQSALLTAAVENPDEKNIFVKNKLVKSIKTSMHNSPAANRVFMGALRLSQRQRSDIIEALNLGKRYLLENSSYKSIALLDFIILLLVRSAIKITPVSMGKDQWHNPARHHDITFKDKSTKEIKKLKLQLANRSNDGFYSVLILRRLSKPITAFSIKFGISPNTITFISLLIGFYSAYLFTQGSYILGALFFQLSLIVDCSDGEVARYTRKFSDFGRWFDASTDRVKEYLVYGALAYSATDNSNQMWILAISLMALQTFRHLSDYTFTVFSNAHEGGLQKLDIDQSDDGYTSPNWRGESEIKYWVKKILNFPIGERWLAISVLAAVGGGELLFPVMIGIGLISLSYAWLTRIRRTMLWKSRSLPQIESNVVLFQQDLALVKKRLGGNFEWMLPSILRLIEISLLSWLLFSVSPTLDGAHLFFILFGIVYHHYDGLYRSLQNQNFPLWLSSLGLRVEGRLLVFTIAVALSLPTMAIVVYSLILFIFVASIQWFNQIRPSR